MARSDNRPAWTEFGGRPGGPTGSSAADEARRMRALDPEDSGPWQGADDQRPRRQR